MPDTETDKKKKRNPFNNSLVDPRRTRGMYETPQYRDEDGEINQRYRSGRGMSAVAGIKMGAAMGRGQGEMYNLGAVLGGAIGGALNKNLGGIDLYNQDLEATAKANETTAAQQRLEMQAQQMEINAQNMKVKFEREQRAAEAAQARNMKDLSAIYEKNINQTSGEERIEYQRKHASLFGLDPSSIDEDYMVGWKPANLGGDINYQVDSNGRVREAQYNGMSISRLGIKDMWDIAAKEAKLNPANEVDVNTVKDAFSQAEAVLNPMKDQFKTNKGQFNATQFNAQRLQLVNKILASQKGNPELEKVDMEVNVNGVPTMVSVPLKKGIVPPAATSAPTDGEGKVWDATQVNGGQSDVQLMSVPKPIADAITGAKSKEELQKVMAQIAKAPASPEKDAASQMANARMANVFNINRGSEKPEDYINGGTSVANPVKYQSLDAIPKGTDFDPSAMPLNPEELNDMLSKAEAGRGKHSTFLFKLNGETYIYNFNTKKVKKK